MTKNTTPAPSSLEQLLRERGYQTVEQLLRELNERELNEREFPTSTPPRGPLRHELNERGLTAETSAIGGRCLT
jgi:hypothetical protein